MLGFAIGLIVGLLLVPLFGLGWLKMGQPNVWVGAVAPDCSTRWTGVVPASIPK